MTTSNESRESMSDEKMKPTVWYVYILDEGNKFYVGQTNDMEARLVEHGTKGRSAKLVWFNQASSREAAKTMEARLQRTLDNDQDGIVRLVDQFDRLLRIMRPEKNSSTCRESMRSMKSIAARFSTMCPTPSDRTRPHVESGLTMGKSVWAQRG